MLYVKRIQILSRNLEALVVYAESVPDAPLVTFVIRITLSRVAPETLRVDQGSLVSLIVTAVDRTTISG